MDLDTIHQMGNSVVKLQPSEDGAKTYEGHWEGRYVPSQYHYMMAWATVDALNQVPEIPESFVLSELKTFTLAGHAVVAVALSYVSSKRREEILVGAAPERGDGQGAAVRAVLDAVNRRLGQLSRQQPPYLSTGNRDTPPVEGNI